MSPDRFDEASSAVNRQIREFWESHKLTPVGQYIDFVGDLSFYLDAVARVTDNDVLRDSVGLLKKRSDSEDLEDESSLKSFLEGTMDVAGRMIFEATPLVEVVGLYLRAQVLRRFALPGFFGPCDDGAQKARETEIEDIAIRILKSGDGWGIEAAVALSLLPPTRLRDGLLEVAAEIEPRDDEPVIKYALSHVLFETSRRNLDLPVHLLLRLVRIVALRHAAGTEGGLWEQIVLRAPAELGWAALPDLVDEFEGRASVLITELPTSGGWQISPGVLDFSYEVCLSWVGAYEFDRARRFAEDVLIPLDTSYGGSDGKTARKVLLAALSAPGSPPVGLLEHLLAEGEGEAVAVLVLRDMHVIWPNVEALIDRLPVLVAALLSGVPAVIRRALWPFVDRINFLLSTGAVSADMSVHGAANEAASRLLGPGVVESFRAETGWDTLLRAR